MKIAGIIAEYNPFHNGHHYQMKQIKTRTGADFILVVMSGNYMQRGIPAIMDKYSRASMALHNGADLVLEMPVIGATGSAEFFARTGVQLLNQTGIVTHLCFGAECRDLPCLAEVADALVSESGEYRASLQQGLKKGLSFPAARMQALGNAQPDLLLSPNNILAVEYLKALSQTGSALSPVLIPRIGDQYHCDGVSSSFASATAIRKILFSYDSPDKEETLDRVLPSESLRILRDYGKASPSLGEGHATASPFLKEDDFSAALGYRLLSLKESGYREFADCDEALSNRIGNLLPQYQSFTQFAHLLKCKNQTYAGICRALLHILLNITKEDMYARKAEPTPYLRVLGFRRNSSCLLSELKKRASAPLVTKVADACHILSGKNLAVFQKDLSASDLYIQTVGRKCGRLPANDFRHGMVIIP